MTNSGIARIDARLAHIKSGVGDQGLAGGYNPVRGEHVAATGAINGIFQMNTVTDLIQEVFGLGSIFRRAKI